MQDCELIVVEGIYDSVKDVLKLANLRDRLVPPAAVGASNLQPHQLLIVSCPARLDVRAWPRSLPELLVRAGGARGVNHGEDTPRRDLTAGRCTQGS